MGSPSGLPQEAEALKCQGEARRQNSRGVAIVKGSLLTRISASAKKSAQSTVFSGTRDWILHCWCRHCLLWEVRVIHIRCDIKYKWLENFIFPAYKAQKLNKTRSCSSLSLVEICDLLRLWTWVTKRHNKSKSLISIIFWLLQPTSWFYPGWASVSSEVKSSHLCYLLLAQRKSRSRFQWSCSYPGQPESVFTSEIEKDAMALLHNLSWKKCNKIVNSCKKKWGFKRMSHATSTSYWFCQ